MEHPVYYYILEICIRLCISLLRILKYVAFLKMAPKQISENLLQVQK